MNAVVIMLYSSCVFLGHILRVPYLNLDPVSIHPSIFDSDFTLQKDSGQLSVLKVHGRYCLHAYMYFACISHEAKPANLVLDFTRPQLLQ